MKFIDLNLKAADEAAMNNALLAAGFLQDSETGAIYPPDSSTSLLLLPEGAVTHPTGEVQVVDGVKQDVREVVSGYHANVRTADPELAAALAPVTVVVDTPQYVWAS